MKSIPTGSLDRGAEVPVQPRQRPLEIHCTQRHPPQSGHAKRNSIIPCVRPTFTALDSVRKVGVRTLAELLHLWTVAHQPVQG